MFFLKTFSGSKCFTFYWKYLSAHLCGAYAIPLAFSIVHLTGIYIFCANVHQVPGLCFLGIGGTPNISPKIILINHFFTFLISSLKPPQDDTLHYARRFPKSKVSLFIKIIVKSHLQAFWQNFENGKIKKIGFCLQDL